MTAEALLTLCSQNGWTIATAESCTAGLIAGALTELPGSSAMFDRGFVTYSNDAKQEMLGVLPETLAGHGAVSEEVAREMALGALTRASCQLAVSVTGIAGPGGSEHKPEGRVCFAIATPKGVASETQDFGALGRSAVRATTVAHAIGLLFDTALQMCPSNGQT